ncbi:hypothetical protein Bca101_031568 [Brassica carinata]
MAIGPEDGDPESREGPPKDRYRPLHMVSLKVLQSEDRDLARSMSSTPHGSRQLPTDCLANEEARHKQREETSSEIIPDGSGAEGTLPTENKDTKPSQSSSNLVAPVDECDYPSHGRAEDLHHQERLAGESPIARESTDAGARDKSLSRSPDPREKRYPSMQRGTTRQGKTPTILNKPA